MSLTRRAFLAAPAVAIAAPAGAAPPLRLATLDWALLETLLALGLAPVAGAELRLYRAQVIEPALTPGMVDLGLRGTPNYEALLAAKPDRIFSSGYTIWAEAQFARIAPVTRYVIHGPGRAPLAPAAAALRGIAEQTGRAAEAAAYQAGTDADFAAAARRIAEKRRGGRPVVIVNFGDARHVRVFGADSVFGETAQQLGLTLAWDQATRYSATAPVGIEALARMPDASILVVPPVPPEAEATLARGALWHALPNVAAGNIAILPSCNPFGGLPTARRFARAVAAALEALPA